MLVYILVLINIVLLVTGQLLFKIGLTRTGAMTLQNLPAVFLSPLIWTGLGLYVIATLIWFAVLSRAQLNVVYPLQSLSYILALVGSKFPSSTASGSTTRKRKSVIRFRETTVITVMKKSSRTIG